MDRGPAPASVGARRRDRTREPASRIRRSGPSRACSDAHVRRWRLPHRRMRHPLRTMVVHSSFSIRAQTDTCRICGPTLRRLSDFWMVGSPICWPSIRARLLDRTTLFSVLQQPSRYRHTLKAPDLATTAELRGFATHGQVRRPRKTDKDPTPNGRRVFRGRLSAARLPYPHGGVGPQLCVPGFCRVCLCLGCTIEHKNTATALTSCEGVNGDRISPQFCRSIILDSA